MCGVQISSGSSTQTYAVCFSGCILMIDSPKDLPTAIAMWFEFYNSLKPKKYKMHDLLFSFFHLFAFVLIENNILVWKGDIKYLTDSKTLEEEWIME